MKPSNHLWTDPSARIDLLEELYQRFAKGNSLHSNARLYWKKYAWLLVVRGTAWIKRVLDIVVAAAAALLLLPLFGIVALAIKLTDGGPVLFWQKRVGKWGKEFNFPKFRSMVVNAEALKAELLHQSDHGGQSITFKMKRDPRITWIGRLIRKLSIDELPQLWCVIHGDMSLVGPRPPTVAEVAQYTLADRRRLDVTPGLTCIWQISGRGDIPFHQQVELDLDYIRSRSLRLDLIILLKTIPAVLLGRGAY
ncbi:MAG: sugar transferase [Verrucomicrobiota bacterium]|nr:sugar transferase [Verrucomicrobiota bacterium]MDD8046716.1 sugar transferase [Verrucomicrobiota bacterium]MDD8051485.1 sugar transferase [Verrucomicrobiota bacterium]